VNWIFKEHPASRLYITRDVDLRTVFEGVRSNHIRFMDSETDFNAQSLRYLAHAIVTCLGTAGLEYAKAGIPCVLGGESPYSGFGFTVEPADKREYAEVLGRVGTLGRLTADQTARAKVVVYFYFCVSNEGPYYLCPHFEYGEISGWNDELSERLWRKACADLADEEHPLKVREQVERLSCFARDPEWTQYIDTERFPPFASTSRAGEVGPTDEVQPGALNR
jgi:hypothetical protein